MVKKMLLTGAMVVIRPGTSYQLLIGLMIAILYMLAVLKTAPFLEDSDDWLSFSTSLQLVLTLLFGLVLKLNNAAYPENSVGSFLIALQVLNFLVFAGGLMMICPCCRARLHKNRKQKERDADREQRENERINPTVVVPLPGNIVDAADAHHGVVDRNMSEGESSSGSESEDEQTIDALKDGLKVAKKPGVFKVLIKSTLD